MGMILMKIGNVSEILNKKVRNLSLSPQKIYLILFTFSCSANL